MSVEDSLELMHNQLVINDFEIGVYINMSERIHVHCRCEVRGAWSVIILFSTLFFIRK